MRRWAWIVGAAGLVVSALGWVLQPDGKWIRRTPQGNEPRRNAQSELMERARARYAELTSGRPRS